MPRAMLFPLVLACALVGAGGVSCASPAPAPPHASAAAATSATAPDRAVLTPGFSEIHFGLTDLRQAAKSGEPPLLREAEREVLGGVLDALDASLVGTPARPNPELYRAVVQEVQQASGLFKYVPYALEVHPGGDLPVIRLTLRRSAYPAIRERRAPFGWKADLSGDTVILTPPSP